MADFAELYKSYFNMVYKLCLCLLHKRELAMDVAQEAFLHSYEKLEELHDREKFLSWVSAMALNLGKNTLKRERGVQLPLEEGPSPEESYWLSLPEEVTGSNGLRYGLLALSWEAQQILLLRYYYSMSEKDIGQIMDLSVGTVKSRLFRSKQQLCENMAESRPGFMGDAIYSYEIYGQTVRE